MYVELLNNLLEARYGAMEKASDWKDASELAAGAAAALGSAGLGATAVGTLGSAASTQVGSQIKNDINTLYNIISGKAEAGVPIRTEILNTNNISKGLIDMLQQMKRKRYLAAAGLGSAALAGLGIAKWPDRPKGLFSE